MSEFARCAGWIAAALEHSIGGWTLEDVREGLEAGECALWPGERSALVTEPHTRAHGKVVEVVFAGGDGDELVNVILPQVEADAKAKGCVEVQIAGRLGWVRRLKDSGYEPLYTVIRKRF